ncbi:MAG: class II aldolase/adducin family protein [Candidatus Heimdallarchaeota archaeon]|nr:class II aldolase/adducin family protein [Candidatus Heimdallarchaeota archaeon]
MSEIYTGVKFKIKKLGNLQKSEMSESLANKMSKVLSSLPEECSPGSSGNVSVKTEEGILISSSGTHLRNLVYPNDFCKVVSSSEEKRISYYGSGLPSSETRMHLLIFKKRPDMRFCLHVHLPNIEKLQILNRFPVTRQFLSYGTIDLAKEASNLLQSNNTAILRDHGIVVVGKEFDVIVEEVRRISNL